MHESSFLGMKSFLSNFDKKKELKILDVGSYSFEEKNYKELMSPNWKYVGIDISTGKNVDIVVDPFHYPFKDNTFDIVISGQCMEHVTEIWSWVKEIHRVLKVGGSVCIIAPSTGKQHTEHDCWRILPQGMEFILKWAGFKEVISFLNNNKKWNDTVGRGVK